MSKQSNPTIIGAFVVGAVILMAVGVAIFGGAELLRERSVYVAYFVEETQGLRQGSNVIVNGVRVGQVSGVALIADDDTFAFMTEVTFEIYGDSYIVRRDGVLMPPGTDVEASLDQLIDEAGLRATLEVESIVTGQLMVDLRLRPDTPAIRRGGADTPYPEVPTIPSRSQEILNKVRSAITRLSESFDVENIGGRIDSILTGVDEIANSKDIRDSLAGINSIINQEDTQALTSTLRDTLDEFRVAAGNASALLKKADGNLDDLKPAIQKMVGALDELQGALATAKAMLQGESAETYQLGNTMHEVERAARSLREFLDYLERHPESLLRGKK